MSATAMTPTNTDLQIHKLFYDQCLKDIKVVVHNKSATHAFSAIEVYMTKISVEKYNSDMRGIMESYGFEPSFRCIEMIQLSSSTQQMLRIWTRTKRDEEKIRKSLECLYNTSPENKRNIIMRVHLARLLKIELAKFDEFYSSFSLIHLGKKRRLYFCQPTHCMRCDLFNYTNKTYMTLGYIAKLFQTHTTGFQSYTVSTNYYDRHERELMKLPNSTTFNHNGYDYRVQFNCHMYRDDIDKRTACFTIENPVLVTKTRPGDKTIREEMNYIFLCQDDHGNYYDKKFLKINYVVLTNDFDYEFDSFDEGSKASQQMKALVDEFQASNCGLSFYHYFLKKLPIEKQLLFVATFFTRQSVWRDF